MSCTLRGGARAMRLAVLALVCAIVPSASDGAAPLVREFVLPSVAFPSGLAVDRRGAVWVAVTHADKLVRFDPGTATFSEVKLPNRTHPRALLADVDGNIWFAGTGLGLVGRLEPGQTRAKEFALPLNATAPSTFPAPWSLTYDPASDEVWFTVHSHGLVGHVRRTSEPVRRAFVVREVVVAPARARLEGIAADGRGGVWIAESAADRLTRIDVATGSLRRVVLPIGSRPRGIARARDGSLWVTLFGSHRLLRVVPGSGETQSWTMPSAPRSNPLAIAVDPRGRVWVAAYDGGAIARFDPRRQSFAVFHTTEPRARVEALATDEAGRVWYVTGFGGRLGVIDPEAGGR